MKYCIRISVFLSLFLALTFTTQAQTQEIELTLDQVIELSMTQSPQAFIAKNSFRSSYWSYRAYRGTTLPKIELTSTLGSYDRSLGQVQQSDGTYAYAYREKLYNDIGLSIGQNIPLTGGSLSLKSTLNRLDYLDTKTKTFNSIPFELSFEQPIMGYNSFYWSKKIEPLQYQEAQRNYIQTLEEIKITAIGHFFELSLSQINLDMAQKNYSNNDTLFKIAQGRYNIGTIARNELLQIELNYLNSAVELNSAKLDLERKKFNLRSYLGFNDNVNLKLNIPYAIPKIEVKEDKTLSLALKNNPDVLAYQRQLIEEESKVARAKADRFGVTLGAKFGLNDNDPTLNGVYEAPKQKRQANLYLKIPVLDWGEKKGNYLKAVSNQEKAKLTVKQAQIDFEQDIKIRVQQFNMQDEQLVIAQKADTIGQAKYDVTLQRFYIGKVDVVNLNIALNEKDAARRQHISALRNFWNYYFNLRKLTLYDFIKNEELKVDFNSLL